MNAFIPTNPKVVIKINDEGDCVGISSNINPELEVIVCVTKGGFDYASQGLPFTVEDFKSTTNE